MTTSSSKATPAIRGARRECFRLLGQVIGHGHIGPFLQTPQPAMGDRTPAQLLQHDPFALLKRLRSLAQDSPEEEVAA